MKIKLIGLFLFVLLFSTSLSAALSFQQKTAQQGFQYHASNNDASFDRLIIMLLKIGHYPSMSACVIKNTTIIWGKGYGLYDLGQQKPATNHTIYVVASITKTVTSTALMQLYEQGFFQLDDDINMYLPFSLRNPNFPTDPITIQMVLSHSSSLNPDPLSYHWFNYSQPPPIPWYPSPWLDEYLLPGGAYYTPEIWDIKHHPGEYMQYANINFDLVAYLVQLFSGQPFYEYCNDHIFTPLAMTHTSFRLPDLPVDDVAIPYLYQNRTYEKLPYYQLLHYPIGGLMTTVGDLSHFLIAHMNHGVYNGTRILQNETVALMHTIQPPGNIYYNFHYGLGWMIVKRPVEKNAYIGHSGDIPGLHTRMYMDQSENSGIICFFNSDRSTYRTKFVSILIQHILFEKGQHLL
ncbi:MAG TPA: serine hydrolase domain-containing protein [Candidatus Thermoplasmatota archaeon]|nr:serine hydrolase domain-containing protein [Candidatus Thermoplasmatota archaeon]